MAINFQPPWPEWNDNFVNETKWIPYGAHKQHESFSDPISHGELPSNISVVKWQRSSHVYEDTNTPWKIGDELESFDLISHNEHLLKYKVMRWIISSVMCLEKVSRENSIVASNQPNSPGTLGWKPWHHIYSMNKVTKGQPSEPEYNPHGMYYIRLFFMGKWRRITVDDYFPFDEEGKLLLPSSSNKCALWLLILSKALLRVASLSWTEEGDVIDFSVITCLTGWTQYSLDCRGVSIDNMWKAVKVNIVEKSKKDTSNTKFCLTSDNINCNTNKNNYDCDNTSSRVVFGVLAETTTNEIESISPAVEHLTYFCSAFKQPIAELKNIPKWKKLRWVNWALDNKFIEASPGSYLRIINMFSPFSNTVASNIVKEPEKATEDHYFNEDTFGLHGNIMEMIKRERTKVKVEEKKEEVIEDTLQFNFAEIYPYLRQLEIYYKPQDFYISISTNEIEELIHSSKNERVGSVKKIKSAVRAGGITTHKGESKEPSDIQLKSEPYRFFFLFSDTFYCKNIYITMSVVKDDDIKCGYLLCQKYNWKSTALESFMIGIRTAGTKTCLLQLGPGVQVCRVFYCLPAIYSVTFNSETPFTVIDENKLHRLLSHYSKSFVYYGEKLLKAFYELLPTFPNSPQHVQLLNLYKQTFYPPGYKDLTTALKLEIAEDYDDVFDGTFTEYIFELTIPMSRKVALLSDLKVIFCKEEFGDAYLQSLDHYTIKDIELIKKNVTLASIQGKTFSKLKLLNELLKSENLPLLHLPPVPSKSKMHASHKVQGLENNFFLKSENHIEVLRRILNKKPQYLELYPFLNDHGLLLKYREFRGIAEITPIQNLFVIARLTLNIHSTKAVPCSILAETEFPKAVLCVVDADKCERLTAPFGLRATYHLKRNKIGYTVLLCGYANNSMIKESLSMVWRIRVLGQSLGNILHICNSVNPYYCEARKTEPPLLTVDTASGFYLPNAENVIGRFIIGIRKSILTSLYLSVSNEDIEIGLTLKGANEEEIAKSEGKGCIFLPVLLLDIQCGAFEILPSEASESETLLEEEDKDTDEDSSHSEILEEEIDETSEKFSLVSENSSFHSYSKPTVISSSISPCGYDSSHSEASHSTEGEEGESRTSSSHEVESLNKGLKLKKKGTSPNNVNTSLSGSGESGSITANLKVNEKSVSATSINSDSSDTKTTCEKHWKSEESPYGIFGNAAHWKLSLILDRENEDYSFVDNDFVRYRAFKNIKKQWKSEDPNRLKKGKCLRKHFLNLNRTDFLTLQLDPDNISISDVSVQEEEVLVTDEENFSEFNIHNIQYGKIMSQQEREYLEHLLSSSSEKNQLDGLQNDPSSTLRKPATQLERSVSSEQEIKTKKKSTKPLSMDKILERTRKKLENIIHPDQSSTSSSTSEDNQFSEEDLSCPPLPIMTETLINAYSLPFSGKPTLKQFMTMEDDAESVSEEKLKNICLRKKVSLSTIYKKWVAPILWNISKSYSPYCLKDLPIQAYSQKRYFRKLEKTLEYHKKETKSQMKMVKKQLLSVDHEKSPVITARILN